MRQPGTAAGPKGKHRIKFPIHPFHAGKAKQRRQRKRPRLRIGKRQGKPLRFRPVQRPPPASRPGQQGFPHSPGRRLLPVPALRGMRTAGRARGKGQLRPGACWRPGPLPPQLVQREGAPQLQPAVLRQEGAQQGPASRPAEVTFIEPLSFLGQLGRAPRPAAALLDGQPALSAGQRPPSPPFPSILCGAGGEMRCKTVDRSADACYTVCKLKTIGAGKMRK